MDEPENKYEKIQQQFFEEKTYKFLKTKADQDPESLTELEGGLLLLFNVNRYLNLQERAEKYLEFYRGVYEKAKALVDSYEDGTYKGESITDDFFDFMPAETDQYVRLLGDIDLLIQINELNSRFLDLNLEKEPLPEIQYSDYNPQQLKAIEEEWQALEAAGYPADKIEEEARLRGTFKVAFGEENLPPIKPE